MNLTLQRWVPVVLSLITVAVQTAIILLLARRKSRPNLPVFLGYILAYASTTLILTAIYLSPRVSSSQYFYFYMSLNLLLVILEFAVMYELLTVALKPYGAIIDLGKMLFRWAGLFLLVAAALTAFATAGSGLDRCTAGTTLLEKSLRLMECGLLLLFFLFERRLALSWRSRPVSIALGLGISAAAGLICSYLRAHYIYWTWSLYFAENLTYLGVNMFWVINLAASSKESENVMDSPSRLIFQRWNEALAGYGYGNAGTPATVESFLPGIERTVDRVMARRVQ